MFWQLGTTFMREEQCDERCRTRVCCWDFDVLAGVRIFDSRLWQVVAVMKTATFERGVFYATISLVIIGLTLISYVIVERIVQ